MLDTPGFSLLELWEGLEPIRLKEYYPEFAPYEGQCRFSPCYHLSEPGCAVLKAVRAGEISQARAGALSSAVEKGTGSMEESL